MMNTTNTILTFDNYVDLQSRLLLLPLNEEECIGAVISSYTPKDKLREIDGVIISPTKSLADDLDDDDDSDDDGSAVSSHDSCINPPDRNDSTTTTTNNEVVVEEEKKECCFTDDHVAKENTNYVGYILSGIKKNSNNVEPEQNDNDDDWKSLDFASILARCREAPSPISLSFIPPPTSSSIEATSSEISESSLEHMTSIYSTSCSGTNSSSSGDESIDNSSSSSRQTRCSSFNDKKNKSTAAPAPITITTPLQSRLSRWGNQIRNTSQLIASETAKRTAQLTEQAVEAARAAQAQSQAAQQQTSEKQQSTNESSLSPSPSSSRSSSPTPPQPQTPSLDCQIVVQRNDGGFRPAVDSILSNSSVVSIRTASDCRVCPKSYQYQWYASVTPLLNATLPTFQPSAIHIGQSLTCTITPSTDSQSYEFPPPPRIYSTSCSGTNSSSSPTTTATPTLPLPRPLSLTTCPITAETSLFNAARRSLGGNDVASATFLPLEGCGKAAPRVFKFKIEIGILGNKSCSAVTLYQVEGDTAEPIHENVLYGVTARLPDPMNPRLFSLRFRRRGEVPLLPPMVEALSDEEGEMTFKAPSRTARESLLLTLGIANYAGRMADLSVATVLFPEDSGTSAACCETIMSDEGCQGKEETIAEENNHYDNANDEDDDLVEVVITDEGKIAALQRDIVLLRNQLSSKADVIAKGHVDLLKSQDVIESLKKDCEREKEETLRAREDYKDCYTQLRLAEKRIETHDDILSRTKNDYNLKIDSMNQELAAERDKISSLEKTIKSLQNQNAVWEASVKSRDDKLMQMEELRHELQSLRQECVHSQNIKQQLDDLTVQHNQLKLSHADTQSQNTNIQNSLQTSNSRILTLEAEQSRYQIEIDDLRQQLAATTSQNHELLTERNSLKNKSDSLSKEITRIRHHERLTYTTEIKTLQNEVDYLKYTKKKALTELDDERRDNERLRSTTARRESMKEEEWRVLEQRVELERVVGELTEYVDAKERQLETMREVNRALVEDCRRLAESQREKGDV